MRAFFTPAAAFALMFSSIACSTSSPESVCFGGCACFKNAADCTRNGCVAGTASVMNASPTFACFDTFEVQDANFSPDANVGVVFGDGGLEN